MTGRYPGSVIKRGFWPGKLGIPELVIAMAFSIQERHLTIAESVPVIFDDGKVKMLDLNVNKLCFLFLFVIKQIVKSINKKHGK